MDLLRVRSPIVLVHGLFGFDRIQVAGLTVADYFPRVRKLLQDAGNRVLTPRLSPTGGVADRARQLKEFLQREVGDEPVHLVGHSMGGLDSRYMISRLDMARQVLSLTTLGTPHRGTVFADWAVNRLERLVKPVLGFLGVPTQGFYDLTTEACRRFNEEVPDAPGVRYLSVAGRHDGNPLVPEWLMSYGMVYRYEGDNDGIVSLASATYGEHLDVWEGDHFSLVNWLNPLGRNRSFFRDPTPRYNRVLARLAEIGG